MSQYHKALSLKTLRRLTERIRPYRLRYMLISFLGIALAGLDMIPPKLVGNAVDIMSSKTGFDLWDVGQILLLWAAVAFSTQALHGVQIAFASRTGERVLALLRQELFDHLQKLSLRFFDRNHMGRILAAFGSDLDSLRSLAIWGINTITSNSAFMIFSSIMILRTDARMFLAVVWLAPAMTLLNFLYGKRLSRAWQKIRRDAARIGANQAENISGARVVAAFNRQEENLIHFNELQDLNTTNHMMESRQNGIFQPLLQWVRFSGQAIILLYGGYRVVSGQMSAGSLVSVSLYWEWFMMPAVNFGAFFNELVIASSGAERVLSVLDEKPEVSDQPGAQPLLPIEGRVKFENVSFSYLAGRPVLQDVSFEVIAGTTVALVGSTGSGKTTLISLLSRFYEPTSGRVFLDEQDINLATEESLHQQIALVTQANFLFNGTIMENLRYDRPLITEDEIFLATKALGCHERILALKDGYDTYVGEAGSGLSLGERQLICFSRALLRNPRLLLLDEATSALDPATDLQVRRALAKLSMNRTTFIVTHRLRTAAEADLVLMLDHGRLIESGSHEELMDKSGAYAKLYRDSQEGFFDPVPQALEMA